MQADEQRKAAEMIEEKSVLALAGQIGMPEEALVKIREAESELKQLELPCEITALTDPDHYETARISLASKIGEDSGGWKMLACMMHSMLHSGKLYREKEIPEQIFIDTMKCFSRFVREHKVSFGDYGFDRDFWTGRQLSLLLFRLGELEFEMVAKPEDQENPIPEISIHIPSDAVLTPENCRESYQRAEEFFSRYYPDFSGRRFVCHSWLMSPALKELLPGDSRILQFQKAFEVFEWNKEADDVLEWVFKRKDLSLECLPEDTSLQRRMKQYLLAGGMVGEAGAVLKSSIAFVPDRKEVG